MRGAWKITKGQPMEKLFVYGTLMDPIVQERIIGRVIGGESDVLEDFFKSKLALVEGHYPLVIPKPGSQVHGLVLEVSSLELARMDAYETSAYRRFWVRLQSGTEAWVYG
jgi:gamma-glutamylcyclotransferase (GGCT)/AIG2-like uncharacterized protein YtfP